MFHSLARITFLFLAISVIAGCGSFQTTKNVWKGTKNIWNSYVSPPADVDYSDKGYLPEDAKALAESMMGIDLQLAKLERNMQNADKPPTQQWLNQLFETFPWLNGFAGIKNDGTILGQQPADSLKELDFIPLLYEDKKQNSHALRADIQPTPQGPEIMLASPLYDGPDFLGIVVAYFDLRNLMHYSSNAENMVVLSPTALLWPGKYEFAATPLAGVDWKKVVSESSVGTCTNTHGSFYYVVRYLGNLPLIFAIPQKGDFPQGNGDISQGYAFFPQEREKLAPPPVVERKSKNLRDVSQFGQDEDAIIEDVQDNNTTVENRTEDTSDNRNVIEAGSRESVLLKRGGRSGREVEERQLEGENVPVERVERVRKPSRRQMIDQELDRIIIDEPEESAIQEEEPRQRPGVYRPSPFGPQPEEKTPHTLPGGRPSPFGPASQENLERQEDSQHPVPREETSPETQKKSTWIDKVQPDYNSESEEKAPATRLPGGRPSPFGPAN